MFQRKEIVSELQPWDNSKTPCIHYDDRCKKTIKFVNYRNNNKNYQLNQRLFLGKVETK